MVILGAGWVSYLIRKIADIRTNHTRVSWKSEADRLSTSSTLYDRPLMSKTIPFLALAARSYFLSSTSFPPELKSGRIFSKVATEREVAEAEMAMAETVVVAAEEVEEVVMGMVVVVVVEEVSVETTAVETTLVKEMVEEMVDEEGEEVVVVMAPMADMAEMVETAVMVGLMMVGLCRVPHTLDPLSLLPELPRLLLNPSDNDHFLPPLLLELNELAGPSSAPIAHPLPEYRTPYHLGQLGMLLLLDTPTLLDKAEEVFSIKC
jgi:hypothetical protein